MKRIFFLINFTLLGTFSLFADSSNPHHSNYKGQESRNIKSLSPSDIDELQNGRGWGLAKAAELNGVPGPAHLLEMKTEIALTPQQIQKIEALFQQMQQQAIEKGKTLIALELKLNQQFAQKTITDSILKQMLTKIATTRSELRYIHLRTHLATPTILTEKQIARYNQLRGYTSDPCQTIPAGHNAEMWKKHNGCE